LVPTPFVAFGVKHFKAAAGIMVTASHNPKRDNGFKVYWNNGCQIIPPHDSGIAEKILANLRPWIKYDTESVLAHPLARVVTDEVADAYYNAMKRLSFTPVPKSQLLVTYTAMHGVGKKWLLRAFELYGHAPPSLVEAQCEPDPNFPTVVFPNPEEKGALDLAMKHAENIGSKVIIANDPDADRLALAEHVHVTSTISQMKWHVFTGNEIGVILGHYQIMRWKLRRALGLTVRAHAAVLATVVSSRMLRAIATTEGLLYCDTLTGFKWIGNKAVQLSEGDDPVDVVFAYEEALGYCVGDAVADKDGISAAVSLIEFAHSVYAGQLPGVHSIHDYLLSIYKIYGQFVSYNGYFFCYDPKVTDAIFLALRHRNSSAAIDYGTTFAGVEIVSVKDVTLGYDSTTANHVLDLPKTPDSHMIMYEFTNGCSLTLRTSGTEPKIKYYTEMQGETTADVDSLKESLINFVDAAVAEMLEPIKHNLTKP
jgi:phosphomannomutase